MERPIAPSFAPPTPPESAPGLGLAPADRPDTPTDLKVLFSDLKAYVQQHANTARRGFGGMWTAEEDRGDHRVRFIMSDGGYNQYLMSIEFGFRLRDGFTHARGDFVDLEQGTLEQVQACHRALGLSRPAAIVVGPAAPSSGVANEAAALLATFQDEGPAPVSPRASMGA